MKKKRIFSFITAIIFLILLTLQTSHGQEVEPPDNFYMQVYLTVEDALELAFPDCDEIIVDEFTMTAEEKSALEQLLHRRLYEDGFRVYIGKKEGAVQGYAIITEEIGKFHPFTFIVAVNAKGKITNLAVLVYRESRGGEIAKKRFLYQFIGKSLKNHIRINKDIINITGATMSVRYLCAGVKKVLAVINEYYLSGKRDVSKITTTRAVHGKPTEKAEKPNGGKSSYISFPSYAGSKEIRLCKGAVDETPEVKLFKQARMIMGTFAEISVYTCDEEIAGRAIEAALDEMDRMDRIMSNYKNDSELSKLNREAAKSPVPCKGYLLDIIERSQYYSRLTDGAFQITVSPLVDLWGFFNGKKHLPSDEEIENLLPATSYKNIVVKKEDKGDDTGTVFFKHPDTQIDLGAIGKGYAVDKALEEIEKAGIRSACINLGGNIYVLGKPTNRAAWRIGVQHPRNKREILGYLEIVNEATATSGDYERFFEIDGKRYSHIIDPRTGRTVNGTISVTIVAPTAIEADALSTSVFVMGPEKGLKFIQSIPDAEALIVYEGKDGCLTIDMTDGFQRKFTRVNYKGEKSVRWHVVASSK